MQRKIEDVKRIVIKIGTSSITYENGNINLGKMEELSRVITDINNSGKDVVLVSSGAIGAGIDRMGLVNKPKDIQMKQAAAAVGQAILMQLYQKFFGEYNQNIAQILLTSDVFSTEIKKINAGNTFNTLFSMGIVPIVNENDCISTDEIEGDRFGDNDTLSAMVATLVEADLLIILSDVEDELLITIFDQLTENVFNKAFGDW